MEKKRKAEVCLEFVLHDWKKKKKSCKIVASQVVEKVKASAHNVADSDLIPGSGRSPVEGNTYPLQDTT